ncbi:hypothetical protein F3Y22_tig00112383pilonHSYRG00533 [Hibiscus syriacus]|uniref:RNase H type-1 domain-containing protein n=1 Tax=Hibiscus syriacus TaxID=106335 RepID=A0A6A2XKX2_HIBSY|nr:hypothetical protein F3Y22_tig00112383pilonHSYRG00533 [Hibiscus syriacus]
MVKEGRLVMSGRCCLARSSGACGEGKIVMSSSRISRFWKKKVSWEPPPEDWYKVNSDGAYDMVSSRSGCGGVIRGQWIGGFACGLEVASALEFGLWGAMIGLRFAWDLGLKRIILEIDSIERNKAADCMARMARSMTPGLHTFITPPGNVRKVIQAEADN